METNEVYVCGYCMEEEKQNGHLLGPNCQKMYQEYVMEILARNEQPETRLEYALRGTRENLRLCENDLQDLKDQSAKYWDEAYRQIQKVCWNIRLPKEKFLQAVKSRMILLLYRAGNSEAAEALEDFPDKIRNLKSQISWYQKLQSRSEARTV